VCEPVPVPFEARTETLDGGIHHIFVRGELDLGTAPRLADELSAARTAGGASILIDLRDCEFIDSSGLALIVESWRELERRQGDDRLVICCAGTQVQRLLRITGTDQSIPVFDGADEALGSLRSD
jgi:anti-sigma B factor antagonist